MTIPSPVTAFADTPRLPLFDQVVIVHHVVIQFVPVFHLSHSVAPATHPGDATTAHHTTALVAKAVLFVRFESPGLAIDTLNVTLVPLAQVLGVTGIRTISFPVGGTMLVVFVHVTQVPT